VTVVGEPDPVAAGRTTQLAKGRSLAEAALRAYVADREPSDGDGGGDGNSAVPKSRPNIPNTVPAVAPKLRKAARDALAEDNWQIQGRRSETRSPRISPNPRGEVPPARRKDPARASAQIAATEAKMRLSRSRPSFAPAIANNPATWRGEGGPITRYFRSSSEAFRLAQL